MPTSDCKFIASPVGQLQIVASDDGLLAVLWEHERPGRVPLGAVRPNHHQPVILETERQLAEYFAGDRTAFTLPRAPAGTSFQREVWAALRTIPYGATRTYADIARQIGRPGAFRAVGAAIGRNPISIITPCHRVIGAAGALTGFAGGLKAKAFLINFESASIPA